MSGPARGGRERQVEREAPPPTDGARPGALSVVLQLLGAVAGLGAVVTFVGAALVWIRFDALHLPADQAVALLPRSLLLAIGGSALAGPVIAGLVVLAVLVAIRPFKEDGTTRVSFWIVLGVLGLIFLVYAVVKVSDLDLFWSQLIVYLAVFLGVGAVVATAIQTSRRRYVAWVVFAVFVAVGSVLAVVRTAGRPRMEPVAVLLGPERAVSGFFVGQTDDRLYVAPLPGSGDPGDPFADADIDRVLELRRSEVTGMALRAPAGIRANQSGREQAQSLLADLRLAEDPLGSAGARREVITTVSPVSAFAPVVHLHAEERLLPMSAESFLNNSALGWVHQGGCPDFAVALGRHAPDRRVFESAVGRTDVRRLGAASPNTYAHVAGGKECRDRPSERYTAADHTRPYDSAGRRGLDRKEGFFLDLVNAKRAGAQDRVHKQGAQRVIEQVPSYYEVQDTGEGRGRRMRITYWLFYGLSQPPGPGAVTRHVVHEGDWERLSVLLEVRGRSRFVPLSAMYHFHDEAREVTWTAVRRVGTGGPEPPTHPVVYSARGSHASYPRAGRYENAVIVGGRRRGAVFDEAVACPDCPVWKTWERLVDAQLQPWYGFGGAWGNVGGMAGTTGPLGPSRFKLAGLSPSPENVAAERRPVPTGDERVRRRARAR